MIANRPSVGAITPSQALPCLRFLVTGDERRAERCPHFSEIPKVG
jgi:hypothetical protein